MLTPPPKPSRSLQRDTPRLQTQNTPANPCAPTQHPSIVPPRRLHIARRAPAPRHVTIMYMRPALCALFLLSSLACDKPTTPAAPTPQAPPPRSIDAAPEPDPDALPLDALLKLAAAKCRVFGQAGSKPLHCGPILRAIDLRAATSGHAALPAWADALAAMTPDSAPALSWIANTYLTPLTRALALEPQPQHKPHAERIVSALTAACTWTAPANKRPVELHLLAEPVAHLAGLYGLSIAPLLSACAAPHHERLLTNMLRAAPRHHRVRHLTDDQDALLHRLASSPALLDAALDAPLQIGAWQPNEAKQLCALYTRLHTQGVGQRPMESHPAVIKGLLSCDGDAQRLALTTLRALATANASDALPEHLITTFAQRCSPHPFSPWQSKVADGLCDQVLALLDAYAQSPHAHAATAARVIGEAWPTPAGEAALKRLERDPRPEIQQAAQRGLQLIETLRRVQQRATTADKP